MYVKIKNRSNMHEKTHLHEDTFEQNIILAREKKNKKTKEIKKT